MITKKKPTKLAESRKKPDVLRPKAAIIKELKGRVETLESRIETVIAAGEALLSATESNSLLFKGPHNALKNAVKEARESK